MPTQKRRLSITLEDEQYELLHRLAELNSQTMSSLVLELVGAAQPMLSQMVEAAERYLELDQEARVAALRAFEAEHDRLVPQMQTMLKDVHAINQDTIDAFKNVK